MGKSPFENRCRYVRWVELHFLALVGAEAQQMNTIFYFSFSQRLLTATDIVTICFIG